MIYFANFNYPLASRGITVNVEVCSDEDKIKTLTIFHQGTSAIIKESEIPRFELATMYDAAKYEIDMQLRAAEEQKGKDLSERVWDIGSTAARWYGQGDDID